MNMRPQPGSLDAVIFDFGGVILNLDYPATDRALRELLGDGREVRYTKSEQGRVFDDFEVGAIDSAEFYRLIRDAAQREVSDEAIAKAWNAMLLDSPPERLAFVQAVAARYRTFLFSNTNPIHKEAFDKTLALHLGAGGFDKLFEKAYYSHTFGMRKPHPETYQKILSDNGLEAGRTLLIDDNLGNIEGAQRAGLQTYHLIGDLMHAEPLKNLLTK
jgi:FMN phosphatase YigB (HAD superfamily)